MTSYNLQNVSSTLCLPQPRTNNLKISFLCTMDHSFGILFLRKLKRANPFLPFGRKSLLTLIIKRRFFKKSRIFFEKQSKLSGQVFAKK